MKKISLSGLHIVLMLSVNIFFIYIPLYGQADVSFPKVDKEPLSDIPEGAIVLYDNWYMKESALIGMDGSKISSPGIETDNWYPTSVPTTVLGTLVRNGVYPDPYIGMNNMKIPDACDAFNERYDLSKHSHLPDGENPWLQPYWFRKEFQVPFNYTGKVVWLNIDGINYRADIWINGRLVADAEDVVGMFRRFRLNITDYVKPGKTNILAVAVHQLDYPGDPVEAQLESLDGGFGPNSGDGEILRNVTQYTGAGWDWVPAVRDRNVGIWQHISINASGPVVVADPAAFTDVNFTDELTADVKIRFYVNNTSKNHQKTDMVIKIECNEKKETVATINHELILRPEKSREVILTAADFPQLHLKNPNLWWPVNYGEQPLYDLTVVAKIDGEISSKADSKFGVREVKSYILPSGGRAFAVNEKPVRIAGGAWISDFMLSWSAHRYRDEVRLMADGNATLVRVNGCNIMPPDVFFEACDEHGLLVWQDFSRTSATGEHSATRWDHHPKRCDSTVYMDNMIDFISRVRGHSSILMWCGSNEAVPQEDISKALQDHVMPAMDDSRIFIISSHEQPSWAKLDINTFSGGPWQMVRIPEYYKFYDQKPDFTSKNEIGLPSLPPINNLAASIPDFNDPWDKFFPLNQSMSYHDAVGGGNGQFKKYLKIMHEDIGKPSSIAEMLRWGELYNNQVYRTIFEAANRARPRNNLNIIWKTNAAWLSFFWQIYDWYLRPNAGYYTMKSALKPIHVQYSHIDKGIQVVSTMDKDVDVKIIVKVIRANGEKIGLSEYTARINADKTVYIDSIHEMIKDTSLYFVALDLVDHSGNLMDRTVTWTHVHTKWHELLSIPVINLETRPVKMEETEDEVIYSLKIKNSTALPAVNVMLELTNGSFGDEILPAFWSDNALTLMPGEAKTLEVSVRKDLVQNDPCILVEGLNVTPASWNVSDGSMHEIDVKIDNLRIMPDENRTILHFSTSQPVDLGTRITTIPLQLKIDNVLIRNVSVAVKPGEILNGRVELPLLKSGKHTVELGDNSIEIEI